MADLTEQQIEETARALFAHYGWSNPADLEMRDKIQQMRDLALRSVRQEPVAYLCNATRFKLSFNKVGNITTMQGWAKELDGQWVALVDATNDAHMKLIAAPPSASAPEVRQEPVADEQDIFDAVAEYRVAMETVAVPRRELEWLAKQDPQSGLTVGLASDAVQSAKQWLAAPPSASVEQARREALEEAAKLCEERAERWAKSHQAWTPLYETEADECAKAIRALAQGEGREPIQ